MKKLVVDLENCYGIEKFSYEFDFSKRRRFVIYAPNGTMKTSFANTFERLGYGKQPEERVHGKTSKYKVRDETGSDLKPEEIFVIAPINAEFKSQRVSTLLVNKKLKDRYDSIRAVVEERKAALLSQLQILSGLPSNDVETALGRDIAFNESDFFGAVERLRPNVIAKKKSKLGPVLYQNIFEDRVVKLIEGKEFQAKLSEYMANYEELIRGSRYFQLGIFNHDNAEEIADNLENNGFFDAKHSINMMSKTGGKEESPIATKEQLVKVIADEKRKILSDQKLSKAFEAVNGKLNKNEATRTFRRLLERNPAIIPELNNLPQLRDKLWTDYLIDKFDLFDALVKVYDETKAEIQAIFKEARDEETIWQKVLQVYRLRFNVPFDVTIQNQIDAMLHEKAPALAFTHTGKSLKEDDLWKCLSMGERRALYLLHIIFEVMARKELPHKTLYVIDDIADSFDYKNKYAIVEYLYEMSKNPKYYLLIFTHNFDFYRTLVSRFDVAENKIFVEKSKTSVQFVPDKYFEAPFEIWKKQLATNDEMLVATVPFVRNLAHFCGHTTEFKDLTKFLHFKPDTDSKTVGDLQQLFNKILATPISLNAPTRNVKEVLYGLGDRISNDPTEVIALEQKIVLSIAIRMKAEEFMVRKISDDTFWNDISKNQTIKLIDKFKEKFSEDLAEAANLAVLEDVNLMTPENIHLNSFMYEPILDMAAWHLKELYKGVCSMK
jgi:hypothetical protein